jgi:hypothetical protein
MPGYEKFYSVQLSIKTNLIGPQTPVPRALKCCALLIEEHNTIKLGITLKSSFKTHSTRHVL